MAKSTPLTSGLVKKKGDATPSLPEPKKPSAKVHGYYKALTLKLDRARYEALKNAGVKLDKKSQEILVEALDLWFERDGA